MADRRLTLDGQIAWMAANDGKPCVCGRVHAVANVRITLSRGALSRLPAQLNALGAQAPYLLMDENTRRAAGGRAMALLKEAGIPFRTTCLPAEPKPQADMAALPPLLRQTEDCDFILGVGSGVINDLCKMLGLQAGLRTGIVATAPSMDGYASNSSAMIVDGVKTTVYNQTPALVLGDLAVLQNAPAELIGAGVGDMAAKAISIAEWQIAHEITGEYYCPMIAQRMLAACGQAVEGARQSMRGGAQAVRRLTEGLIVSGIAMSAAQVSRPASGSEHTLSHLMDMLAIRRGMPHRLHGIQVGYGVRVALAAYDALTQLDVLPQDGAAVLCHHDERRWERDMRRMFGAQADALIADARREGRNTEAALRARAEQARACWGDIRKILLHVTAQKPSILAALDAAGIPPLRNPQALDLSPPDVLDLFIHSKDLRMRYIVPAMAFDLGLLPWMRERLMAALGIEQDRPRYFDPA